MLGRTAHGQVTTSGPRLPYLEKGGSVPAHPAGAGEDQLGTHQVAFKLEGWHYSGSPLSS